MFGQSRPAVNVKRKRKQPHSLTRNRPLTEDGVGVEPQHDKHECEGKDQHHEVTVQVVPVKREREK